jgi:retron-type reverse transcriptase
VDGMSLKKIQAIIEALRNERHRWAPARRVYIDKKGAPGTRRPLGLPSWSDKLLQEVIRSLLEAYYEPQFSDRSHGFRPGKGCHTALAEVSNSWRGTTWFVEGDISQCFDRLDHAVLRSILAEDIHDNRFLRLVDGLLQALVLFSWVRFRAEFGRHTVPCRVSGCQGQDHRDRERCARIQGMAEGPSCRTDDGRWLLVRG